MLESLTILRLTAGTVYKLIWFGSVFSLVPFGFVMGVLALFDASTVRWNGAVVTGVGALVVGPVAGLVCAGLITALMGSMCVVGLWLFSKINVIALKFNPATPAAGASDATSKGSQDGSTVA